MPAFLFTFFFFNDTATTEIYTLSLHDALPICAGPRLDELPREARAARARRHVRADRKSTRLNSSHLVISYAVFCLKKKKTNINKFYQLYSLAGDNEDRPAKNSAAGCIQWDPPN